MLPNTVGWIDNRDDSRRTVTYLQDLAMAWRLRGAGRLLVRPTPGSTSRAELALDILIALGKDPDVLHEERLTGQEWDLARAWLSAGAVCDLLVDRVHALPRNRLMDLANLAGELRAGLWLMWSSPNTDAARDAIGALNHAGYSVRTLEPHELIWDARPGPRRPNPAPNEQPWPPLPATMEVLAFLDAARQHLPPLAFAALHDIYRDAALRTDQWMKSRASGTPNDLARAELGCYAEHLTGWLRDEQIGPATDAETALIRLRGTQSALLPHGVLLHWKPDALGAEPAARLLGNLNPYAAAALHAGARTDHAAAVALTLHLNHPPTAFADLRCGDVSADGHILLTRRRRLPCLGTGPITLPRYARSILAAHRAYRRHQRATVRERFFRHTRVPDRDPGAPLLNATIRTCERIKQPAPWLHPTPYRYSTDCGPNRAQNWLTQRGLEIHQLAVRSSPQSNSTDINVSPPLTSTCPTH